MLTFVSPTPFFPSNLPFCPALSTRHIRLSTKSVRRCAAPAKASVNTEGPSTDPSTENDASSTRPPSLTPSSTPSKGLASLTGPLDPRVLFGEFLSTFLFMHVSLMTASSPAVPQTLSNAATIAALVAAFIPVCGAHLNPAVTLALLSTNRIPLTRALLYIPTQLLAAAAAATLAQSLGVSVPSPEIAVPLSSSASLVLLGLLKEFLPMFVVVCVVFLTAVATEEEGGVGLKIAPIYIGLTVFACATAFPMSQFNPARAFGLAIASGSFVGHWILWVGPILGAVIASLLCEHVFVAPAGQRQPMGLLTWIDQSRGGLVDKVRGLGMAGLIAYGILNTLYYAFSFAVMMLRVRNSLDPSSSSSAGTCEKSLTIDSEMMEGEDNGEDDDADPAVDVPSWST